MHLKYKIIKYVKICKVKMVLFYIIEHESNLYLGLHLIGSI
jgi:hypothetical protein